MKSTFKKLLLTIFTLPILSLGVMGLSQWVKVQIPEGNRESDVMVTPQESEVQAGEKDIFALIQIINKYLRFSIGALCMVALIVGGFKLLTSEWDVEASKKAGKLLLGSAVGILIAVLSYAIVRLIVNLF